MNAQEALLRQPFEEAFQGPILLMFNRNGRGVAGVAITGDYAISIGLGEMKEVYAATPPWSNISKEMPSGNWKSIFLLGFPVPRAEEVTRFYGIAEHADQILLLSSRLPFDEARLLYQGFSETLPQKTLRFSLMPISGCFLDTDNPGAYILSRLGSSIDDGATYLMRDDMPKLMEACKSLENEVSPLKLALPTDLEEPRPFVIGHFRSLLLNDADYTREIFFRLLHYFRDHIQLWQY